MKERITWQEARDLLIEVTKTIGTESLPIKETYGRICAKDIAAKKNVPPFDRSPFDGYAFRSADTQRDLPVTLSILEEIPAGSVPMKEVTEGTAVKILTGAPMPMGADAVTKFEETEFTTESVTLKRAYEYDENVIHAGEDIQAGEIIAHQGQEIDAGLAGTFASQSIPTVEVYALPKIGILTTGSELKEIDEEEEAGKIPNSNRYSFEAAVKKAGCIPVYLGTPGDSVEEISDMIRAGLEKCDAILTTGGVSVGDYDLTEEAYRMVGAEILCRNVRLKPGGKSCYAIYEGKMLFGLSGNPASALTNFYAAVLPAIRKLTGREAYYPEFTAYLAEDFKKKSKQPRLLRGKLEFQEGKVYFRHAKQQGNGALHTMAGANAIAEIEAGASPLPKGSELKAYYIG
jgi:molybdopterin molybdotransferase